MAARKSQPDSTQQPAAEEMEGRKEEHRGSDSLRDNTENSSSPRHSSSGVEKEMEKKEEGGTKEESKEEKDNIEGKPKVPPLKIVLPQSQNSPTEHGDSKAYVVSKEKEKETQEEAVKEENVKEESRAFPAHDGSHDCAGMSHSPTEEKVTLDVTFHPRKRKLKARDDHPLPSSFPRTIDQPYMNSYKMFMDIHAQIRQRRKQSIPVQPKPPQGFKDYLMNKCTYVLAGNPQSRLAIPLISPPQSLQGPMKDLFTEQEKERYRLRMHHLIEKEKLVVAKEQEILRVHGQAARALANQVQPFSACTFLRDKDIYTPLNPDQDEKDRNTRSRYNGRLFLSWLQDVDDKWEKIKENMCLRHHNEAESLNAVQKMEWEWKLKELVLPEPVADELHVPMVYVSDDFDLFPA